MIGCGYLGTVHAAALAELGHQVVGIDVDAERVRSLSAGRAPFFEPGLPEILRSATATGRLTFSTRIEDAAGARVHFIAVGTPELADSPAADLTYVNAAIQALIPSLHDGDLVVGKSTVPVGTAARIAGDLEESGTGALLAWNPEFLREGFAVRDTLAPDRIVYGLPRDARQAQDAKALLDEVYGASLDAGTPLIATDYATAELVKVAANAFLATKISFINAMAEIAEVTGADVTQLADAIGLDDRIGRKFLGAGVGFGGGCLPKDIRAFTARAQELGRGESVAFLVEVDAINQRRRARVVQLTEDALGGSAEGRRVAILGLAFKPHSDDVRDSPALDVALQLRARGAIVVATDPHAIDNARKKHPELDYVDSAADALSGAEAVVLITEWDEFRYMNPGWAGDLVTSKNIIDARNCLDSEDWRSQGWTYRSLGKP